VERQNKFAEKRGTTRVGRAGLALYNAMCVPNCSLLAAHLAIG
jgi:hypothetical protein